MAKRVFSGLVTACLFADCPTSFSLDSVKATIEGVVLVPSEFSITLASLPSITATQEFVVPKSIPITFAIIISSCFYMFFAIYLEAIKNMVRKFKITRSGLKLL